MRMAVRRVAARRKRRLCSDIWPIDQSAGRPPEGWPGWPEGKKFAVVLTHDVEGPDGLEKVQRLAELEMELGFRSCFNFIPEGPYTVPPDLRSWLTDHGFEVGVHSLHHDGKLYSSWREFSARAKRINSYLKEWGAAGFRSEFMLHELDWIHDLNIQYDASTFDTDPFEPQPDGAGTIFPFWVEAPEAREALDGHRSQVTSHKSTPSEIIAPDPSTFDLGPATPSAPSAKEGYVELPYTLPQDSTLFLVLRETTPEIWLQKLDWIAEHGGMALLNVHPDYIDLTGTQGTNREYAAAMYAELLRYVSQKYAGEFWHPLPRELAGWFKGTRHARSTPGSVTFAPDRSLDQAANRIARLRGKRAAVLLYSYYPSDSRPRRAAQALVEAGMEVDLLCISEDESEPRQELVDGVHVFRLPMKHRRDSELGYFWLYACFLARSFWFLLRHGLRRRYDLVHVHNMPDFLVFGALIPKLRGAAIVLDLHDPMPELMMSIYGMNSTAWRVRLLRALERWSIGFADLALTPNLSFKNVFVSRSCRPEKMQIVMNSPEEKVFDPERCGASQSRPPVAGEFRIMHHGSILHRHGIDLLVEAVARVRPSIPGVCLDIYGPRTPFLDTVLAVADRLGVADIVHYHGAKTHIGIARAIRNAEIGVVPNRRSPFTELNFPTRIFEYLAMRRPIIVPATRGIKDYFSPEQLLMFEPGNVEDLAAKILWVKEHPEATRGFVERGIEVYRQHLWRGEEACFLEHIAALV
jgi:glycosyltransferase involved in cell wall biosynthesis